MSSSGFSRPARRSRTWSTSCSTPPSSRSIATARAQKGDSEPGHRPLQRRHDDQDSRAHRRSRQSRPLCPAPRSALRHGGRPSPYRAGLSGENSDIGELQLIGGEFRSWVAWINRRWLVDFSDRLSHEEALADEFGEAQVRQLHAVQAHRDAQEQIGDHPGDDLQADRVVVRAKEFADIEMLLYPAKQEFDLPAAFVERRDLDRRALDIIRDESDRATLVALDLDAPEFHWQSRIALADEHDVGIVDDPEAVADKLAYIAELRCAQARVHLDPRDEGRVGSVDLAPPPEVIVTLI